MRNIAFFISVYCSLIPFALSTKARAALTPEKETLQLSKQLESISDDRWAEIAGTQSGQEYSITQGDTLYDISNRLFGDAKYWPKVWSLNNSTITNPHLITPGNVISFLPGTGSTLPGIAIAANPQSASESGALNQIIRDNRHSGRSLEWTKLPRQSWEQVDSAIPTNVDRLGFDTGSKIVFKTPSGFELPAIVSSEPLSDFGQITGGHDASLHLGIADVAYLQPEGEGVELNQVYSITRAPRKLRAKQDNAVGYFYQILGKILVTEIRDDIVVGKVVEGQLDIKRGDFLITNLKKIKEPTPAPANLPIVATLIVDNSLFTTNRVVQNKEAFVDKGSNDGIKIGNVFRAYQHLDPANHQLITNQNSIRSADFIVVQVSQRYSAMIALSSELPVDDGSELDLLTDVSDVNRKDAGLGHGNASPSVIQKPATQPTPQLTPQPTMAPSVAASPSPSPSPSPTPLPSPLPSPEVLPAPTPIPSGELPPIPPTAPMPAAGGEDLDRLDQGGNLTPEQERELKQLEKFKKNPDQIPESPAIPPATSPSISAPTAPIPAPVPIPTAELVLPLPPTSAPLPDNSLPLPDPIPAIPPPQE